MKKILFSALALFIFAVVGFGQSKPCNLSLKDSPEIRGLRLGMSKADFDLIIPGKSSFALQLYKSELVKIKGFENVSELFIGFVDKRISTFSIKYDSDAVEWTDAKEFAANLSENLKIPFEFWGFSLTDTGEASAKCKDFEIKIYSPANRITVIDLTIKNAEKKRKDERKKVFKPK